MTVCDSSTGEKMKLDWSAGSGNEMNIPGHENMALETTINKCVPKIIANYFCISHLSSLGELK